MMEKVVKDNNYILKKYPIAMVEKMLNKIEEMGYTVYASESQCLILDGEKIIIDSDFYDDYQLNAAWAIEAFFYE